MNYNPALDGVRALAAFSVVGFHCFVGAFRGGFVGVDIFFVLSGFLITSILVREMRDTGRIRFGRFLLNRLFRLYSALLLMLLILAIYGPTLFAGFDSWREFALPAAYLTDFTMSQARQPDLTQHTWSLSAEMHFYLIWPLIVPKLAKLDDGRAIKALLALFVCITIWRVAAHSLYGPVRAYYAFDTRGSGLILGSALAFIRWRPSARLADISGTAAVLVLAIAVSALTFYDSFSASWGGVAVELMAAVLILCLLVRDSTLSTVFSHPFLVRLGMWSYGIYLWHYPIARIFRGSYDPWIAFLLTSIVSTGLAAASHSLLETPVRRWYRNRSRPGSPAVAGGGA